MSDETPRDNGLPSEPYGDQEARLADECERALAAALARTGVDASAVGGESTQRPAHDAAISNERLATALVAMSREIVPDADFATDLQAQIERRIRERGQHDVPTNGPGGAGDRRRPRRMARRQGNRRGYRPFWLGLAALLLLALLVALPAVQASVNHPLCIGSVCISWGGASHPSPGATGSPTPTPLSSVLDLAGRTTLAQARAEAPFPVRLPAYPSDLGQPDYVFLQNLDGAAVVLVWSDHAHPSQPRLSLFELSSGAFAYKFAGQPIAVATVHGQQAFWTSGPYQVQLQGGGYYSRWIVTGHALIWTNGAITYRLETTLPLAEAVRIAESLR
jgi:hypothetical protein